MKPKYSGTRTTHPHLYTCSSSTRRNLWLTTLVITRGIKKTIKHVGKKRRKIQSTNYCLDTERNRAFFFSVRLKIRRMKEEQTTLVRRSEPSWFVVRWTSQLAYFIPSPPRHPTPGTNNSRRSGIVRPFWEWGSRRREKKSFPRPRAKPSNFSSRLAFLFVLSRD